jgi:hypothetical protein
MKNSAFIRANLPDVKVIMVIMCVLVKELLCHAMTERFQYMSACCQVHVGDCGYVLSCLALNGVASRGPGSRGAYPVLENPQAWLLGSRVCAESEREDKADWADRWRNPSRP